MGIVVQVQNGTTGAIEFPDISVSSAGDITVTFAASVAANSKLIVAIG
jgi:hypothetical protein